MVGGGKKIWMEYLNYYQYVLIAGGLLFLIGAIRDWKWVYQATVGDKERYAFIFEVWGCIFNV